MSPPLYPGYKVGLQVNPTVVALTKLSADLREAAEQLNGEYSFPNFIRAAAEGRIKTDEERAAQPDSSPFLAAPRPDRKEGGDGFDVDLWCALLFKFAEGLGRDANRADSAIPHERLKTSVVSTLNGIRDTLMIPALATIVRRFWPEGNTDRHQPDAETRKRLVEEILDACRQAAEQAQSLALLSDQVYVLADHIRERDRDLAAAERLARAQPEEEFDSQPAGEDILVDEGDFTLARQLCGLLAPEEVERTVDAATDRFLELAEPLLAEAVERKLPELLEEAQDESYVEAGRVKDLWLEHFPSYRQFIAAVEKADPPVRNQTRGRRRLIHIRDLLRFLEPYKRGKDAGLNSQGQAAAALAGAGVAQIERRKAEARARKQAGG
jgi:hypothetical protein